MESQMQQEKKSINYNHHPTGMLDRDQRTARTVQRRQISDTKISTTIPILLPDCYYCNNKNSSNYCNNNNKNKMSSCYNQINNNNTILNAMSLSSSSTGLGVPFGISEPKSSSLSLESSGSHSSTIPCYTQKICDSCTSKDTTQQKTNIISNNTNELNQSLSSLYLTSSKRSPPSAAVSSIALKKWYRRHCYRFLPKSCQCKLFFFGFFQRKFDFNVGLFSII